MSSTPFQQALEFTLKAEGGWADNPADPGGATMQGITLAVFRTWRHDLTVLPSELRAIRSDEVEAIYQALYWNPVNGAHLPPGVNLSMFDAAVNLGVRRAAILLQAALGVVQDGAIGPVTLSAINRIVASALLSRLASEREAFYRRCATFSVFGQGWLSRNRACLLAARRLAGVPVDGISTALKQGARSPARLTTDDFNTRELTRVKGTGSE